MANAGGSNPIQHPLAATASAIGAAGGDPRGNKTSLFMSANEGPAEIAAKISGVNTGGKRGSYFSSPLYRSSQFRAQKHCLGTPMLTVLTWTNTTEDDSAYFTNNEGIPWPDP